MIILLESDIELFIGRVPALRGESWNHWVPTFQTAFEPDYQNFWVPKTEKLILPVCYGTKVWFRIEFPLERNFVSSLMDCIMAKDISHAVLDFGSCAVNRTTNQELLNLFSLNHIFFRGIVLQLDEESECRLQLKQWGDLIPTLDHLDSISIISNQILRDEDLISFANSVADSKSLVTVSMAFKDQPGQVPLIVEILSRSKISTLQISHNPCGEQFNCLSAFARRWFSKSGLFIVLVN
jgi:hypothetical protein